jgi:hypothetical protein
MSWLRPWGVDCVADIEAWLISPMTGRAQVATRIAPHNCRTAGPVAITQTG